MYVSLHTRPPTYTAHVYNTSISDVMYIFYSIVNYSYSYITVNYMYVITLFLKSTQPHVQRCNEYLKLQLYIPIYNQYIIHKYTLCLPGMLRTLFFLINTYFTVLCIYNQPISTDLLVFKQDSDAVPG